MEMDVTVLKTLYIDIYFLINFIIDLVSLYFSAIFTKTKVTNSRLIISAILGALCACLVIFLKSAVASYLASFIFLLGMLFICTPKLNIRRRAAFGASLLIFVSLISGIVSWVWNVLTDIFTNLFFESDYVNRKMLFFSLIVLLSMGVCKMLIAILNNGKIETKIETTIIVFDRTCTTEAFVDTGNLAVDPFGSKPIMIIKEHIARQLIGEKIINLNVDELDHDEKRKIRLIPITRGGLTRVYVGVIPEKVIVKYGGKDEVIDVTIAIDKEGGDFGGCMALMPFSAVKNVFN